MAGESMADSNGGCYWILNIANIHESLTSDEVLEYFKKIDPNACQLFYSLVGGNTTGSMEIAFTQYGSHVYDRIFKQQHEMKGHQLDVLPCLFGAVRLPVSDVWSDVMAKQRNIDCAQFLKDHARKHNIKIQQHGDKLFLEGNIDQVKKDMKTLQASYLDSMGGHQIGEDNLAAGRGSYSSKSTSKAGQKRERKLAAKAGGTDSGQDDRHRQHDTPPEATSSEQHNHTDFPTGGAQKTDNTFASIHTDQASGQDRRGNKPTKPRILIKDNSSQPTTVSPEFDNSKAIGSPWPSMDVQGIISVPIYKHLYVLQYCFEQFQNLRKKCKSFRYDEDGENCNCVFTVANDTEKTRITKALTELYSALPLHWRYIKVEASFEVSDVEAIIATNRLNSVHLHYVADTKAIFVYGQDNKQVTCTVSWLENTLRTNRPGQKHLDTHQRIGSSGLASNSSGSCAGTGVQRQVSSGDSSSSSNSGSFARNDSCGMTATKPRASCSLQFSNVKKTSDRLDFKTGSGLNVHIYQGDMLHQPTEVIVNSANDQLAHGGGLARAILTSGGPQIDIESRQIINAHGALHMGDVVHTTAGNLPGPIRYVIHAVPPSSHQMDMKKDEANCALVKVFSGSLVYADSQLHVRSISLPPFGAGIFAVPIKNIMGAALQGLEEFDRYVRSAPSATLEEIHFISNDYKLAKEMVDAFQSIIDAQA